MQQLQLINNDSGGLCKDPPGEHVVAGQWHLSLVQEEGATACLPDVGPSQCLWSGHWAYPGTFILFIRDQSSRDLFSGDSVLPGHCSRSSKYCFLKLWRAWWAKRGPWNSFMRRVCVPAGWAAQRLLEQGAEVGPACTRLPRQGESACGFYQRAPGHTGKGCKDRSWAVPAKPPSWQDFGSGTIWTKPPEAGIKLLKRNFFKNSICFSFEKRRLFLTFVTKPRFTCIGY